MIVNRDKNRKLIQLDTDSQSGINKNSDNTPKHDQESEYSESVSEASSFVDGGFQADKVIVLNNQFEGDIMHALVDDLESEEEDIFQKQASLMDRDDGLMNEKDKGIHNYKIINQIIAKVQNEKQIIERKLKSVKDNNCEVAIQWNRDEKLHKEANLSIEESKRDIIILKKKKLERLRRDVLNIKNLENEVDPELYLNIKNIEFKEGNEIIKEFFASIDLIVNKNSLIGFNWPKFSERVFKNKDTVDAFIYKLKYFPFNEMSDYYHSLCKKFSEEEKEFLNLLEEKSNRKVPYEIFILKTFVEWMKIMKYGYELNLDLIQSINRTNNEQLDVDKISLTVDILEERLKNANKQANIIESEINNITNLQQQLMELKKSLQVKYNLNDI